MEYLVTMTTHVPDGTSDAAVDDVRAREAVHSRTSPRKDTPPPLATAPAAGRMADARPLSRPADRAGLESVLLSMPLRVWRTDECRRSRRTRTTRARRPEGPRRTHGPERASSSRPSPSRSHRVRRPASSKPPRRGRRTGQESSPAQGTLRRLWGLPGEAARSDCGEHADDGGDGGDPRIACHSEDGRRGDHPARTASQRPGPETGPTLTTGD